MTNKEVIEFIRAMENQIPSEQAEAMLVACGQVTLYANKEGYLRMAIELMKCAFEETHHEAELGYIFLSDSDFVIDHLARTKEELEFLTT